MNDLADLIERQGRLIRLLVNELEQHKAVTAYEAEIKAVEEEREKLWG